MSTQLSVNGGLQIEEYIYNHIVNLQDVRRSIQLPPGVAVSVPGSVERTAQLSGDLLVALRTTILPLPKMAVLDLATFDQTEYEFLDIEEEQEVLLALGSVTEGNIQPEVNEKDRINFAMRVGLAREQAKVREEIQVEFLFFCPPWKKQSQLLRTP